MRLLARLLPVILIPLPVLAAEQAAPKDIPSCVVGDQALAQDQPELALVQYERCLREGPPSFQILSNLGIAYVKLGKLDRAIQTYTQALALNPESAQLHLNVGLAYLKTGKPKEASQHLARALMIDPGNPQALELLALSHYQLKDFELAAYEAGLVHQALPDEDSAAFLLGSSYLRLGLYNRAIPLIYYSVSKTKAPEGYRVLGEAFLGIKAYHEALRAFQDAESADPDLPGIHADMGTAYAGLAQPDKATAEYEKELAKYPDDFTATYFLGRLERLQNDIPAAKKHLEKANQLRPGDPSVAYEYAAMALQDKDFPKAEKLLESIVRKYPGYVDAHVLLAEVYFRLHRTEDGKREKALIDAMKLADQARIDAEGKARSQAANKPAAAETAPHP